MKHLRGLKALVRGRDPAPCINTERAREARSEDAETAGERRGIVRQESKRNQAEQLEKKWMVTKRKTRRSAGQRKNCWQMKSRTLSAQH